MVVDDAETSDSKQDEESDGDSTGTSATPNETTTPPARVGTYTWEDFLAEYAPDGTADELYGERDHTPGSDRRKDSSAGARPSDSDWDRIDYDVSPHLGFHPDDIESRVDDARRDATDLQSYFEQWCDPETTPVRKDHYVWEHYKAEYYYDEEGNPPTEDGKLVEFDPSPKLGFEPDQVEEIIGHLSKRAPELADLIDERTVNVAGNLDEDAFFTKDDGTPTVVSRYDLEKAVPMAKKTHFQEVERYWVHEPYTFVIIFHSTKENEKKYYVIEPYMNNVESNFQEFMTSKLRTAIKYSDSDVAVGSEDDRAAVIERETYGLLERYDLYEREQSAGLVDRLAEMLSVEADSDRLPARLLRKFGWEPFTADSSTLEGMSVRPEPVVLAEDAHTLNQFQVNKLLYYLQRDFIGYERIDGIKHDVNVEDISCDGYNSPVFVYHGDYEQIISNVYHGETELDDFVVKLAQRSGKGISKRRPQVDATLPDGSRAQLTLGREVSDHGTNYTIRQFKEVPFTPIDLINWHTFSLDEMAFLWLCIENHKSLIFAGGTASGKTTSLNAVSLFIPSNAKIVSIEDTREVELPQRNWIASVTRPSFSDDDKGDVDEFDLLEAALRQRPEYIVMGEIRGEEGRTLFQVMSTGHTTYTTFHADSVGEVLKRFTTEPINVSKTMFTALDLVSVQTSTRVQGRKVRRNKSLTEINHYDAENDEINVQDIYQWQAETDQYLEMGESNTLEEIKFDRGWNQQTLEEELFKREVVIAYLIDRGLNTYTEVAATLQAFINDADSILSLIATDELEASLEDLREMESVLIDVDPEMEAMVPRPDPTPEVMELADEILARADEDLFPQYREHPTGSIAEALADIRPAEPIEAPPSSGEETFPDRDGSDDREETSATDVGGDDEATAFEDWGDADDDRFDAGIAFRENPGVGDERDTDSARGSPNSEADNTTDRGETTSEETASDSNDDDWEFGRFHDSSSQANRDEEEEEDR
ncbi:Flp pilus assembly complex ATPase component TadA (plasmid) [Halorarum halophilum]|uniref:Flp pilus assembly complex ATPase component TadA n=1 Tax=Halorarum halophilum TaxID=2743090 RepID=A0A7D5GEP4_9EURY|nr:type II/IV secretion system ATPase subunit [Halobaculum halophilum]QLG29965.1 Flp pilus assembly complex ATPase component TadA [Halobaculum halophilum]